MSFLMRTSIARWIPSLLLVSLLVTNGCSASDPTPDRVVPGDTSATDTGPVDDLAADVPNAPDTQLDDTLAMDDVNADDVTPADDVTSVDTGVDAALPDVPPPPAPIHITPADHVAMLPSGTSATITYAVVDSLGVDLTATSVLTIDDPALGAFAGNVFTTSTTRGGISHVHATHGGQSAQTGLEIDRTLDVITLPGAPADAATRFGGAPSATRTPTIVYPSPNTIVPPNLPSFEVHFRPTGGTDLYEISFTGASSSVRVYATCTAVGGGCVTTLDALTFTEVAIAARASGTVQLAVRATTSAGGAVGTSVAQTLGVTTTPLAGGIYYWVASSGSILRYDFGRAGATPETFMGGGGPFACVGCHTLSRDGTRVSLGGGIPGPAASQIYDVASRTAISAVYGANFETFSPDNHLLLTSDGAHLTLLDGASGAAAPGLAPGLVGSMPDWSPDGSRVVYSRPASVPPFGGSPGQTGRADLMVMPFAAGSFGTATTLVASAGEDNYYPSYSPDGNWVLFNRSASDSYNVIDAHLRAVRSDGSAAPIALSAADGAGDLGNSWPKWAPFVETYQGQPLMWITVSSRRDYGLRLQQQSVAADMRTAQLWMAAFRPTMAPSDPTSPAFWLPIQVLTTGNHIAQWTQQVRRRRCIASGDCPTGDTCANTVCVGAHP